MGTASEAQGNSQDTSVELKRRIATAERDMASPLSYPEIWVKYNAWNIGQSRLRGMVAEGRHQANARVSTFVLIHSLGWSGSHYTAY